LTKGFIDLISTNQENVRKEFSISGGGTEMKKVLYATLLVGFALTLFCACASTTGRTAGELVDDTTIANTIRAKIVGDKDLSILKINTDVFNGNVTLLGVVPSKQAEERLISIAKGVAGVKSVTSKLTIQ
jgi:hyperosmotically inducible periplasmic protein